MTIPEFDALIAGGGAAGLMAACRLAAGGARVCIIEQSDRVGRKLMATGSGRCNLLNMRVGPERYFSRDPGMALGIINRYTPAGVLDVFSGMGLMTREEDEGRVYPASGQAASVLDVLRMAAEERGAVTECGFAIGGLTQTRFGWQVTDAAGVRRISGRRLILACGGRAQPTAPADKSARGLDMISTLKNAGHKVYAPMPVLTPLKCDMSALRGLKGLKMRGAAVLNVKGRDVWREQGELLFTDYGISGIAAMQISRALGDAGGAVLKLDFLPEYDSAQLRAMLEARREAMPARATESFLTGILNRMTAQCVLKRAGISAGSTCAAITGAQLDALTLALKEFAVDITGVQDFKSAQVMRGGAALSGFDTDLRSRILPGLYACGELLDVDGECGGYNLLWAWCSALAVADGILSEKKRK